MIHQYCKGERGRGREGGREGEREGGREGGRKRGQVLILEDDLHCHPCSDLDASFNSQEINNKISRIGNIQSLKPLSLI